MLRSALLLNRAERFFNLPNSVGQLILLQCILTTATLTFIESSYLATYPLSKYLYLWLFIPITDAAKVNILVANISAYLIIGTPLLYPLLNVVLKR